MEIRSFETMVGDVRIHSLQAGTGERDVVLFHGGGTDSAKLSWADLILPLAEAGLRVTAPDQPGFGESDRPDVLYTFKWMTDFAHQYLDALELRNPMLGGISMGGAIVMGLALAEPKRFPKLVLFGPYGIQDKAPQHFLSYQMVRMPGVMEKVWKTYANKDILRPKDLANVFHDSEKAATQEILDGVLEEAKRTYCGRAFTRMQRDDIRPKDVKTNFTDRLGELEMPVLIVHGEHDAGVPLHYAEEAAALLPRGRLEVIRGAGHWVQREKPAEVNPLVISFLADA